MFKSLKKNPIFFTLPFAAIATIIATIDSAQSVQAFDLGAAENYNAFILQNMNEHNTDAEGRIAVGGNATLTDYGIGNVLTNSNGTDNRLVVGGNLTYNGGQVFGGDVVVGGTVNASVYFNCSPNCAVKSGQPINFSTATQEYDTLSQSLGAIVATGTTQYQYGGIELQGNNSSSLDVFTINGSEFSSSSYLNLNNIGSNATVLLNITGNNVNIQNFGLNLNGVNKQDILFNFENATQLTTSSFSFEGSVLAPFANFSFSNGNLEGTLIANSLSGTGELHNYAFQGNLPVGVNTPQPTKEVPEPSNILGLFILGTLSGFPYCSRILSRLVSKV
jgi:choice-of-anchor A domain-containing protein